MKNVLILTDVNYWRLGAGHRVRINTLVKYLASLTHLTVIYIGAASEDYLFDSQVEFISVLNKKKGEYRKSLKRLLKFRVFDVIIVEYIHITFYLDCFSSDALFILDAHDIISERTTSFKEYNRDNDLFKLPLSVERDLMDIYDYVIAICEPDLITISKLIAPSKALLCPHPAVPVKHAENRKEKIVIGFIGSEYLPNVDGLENFLENCWPSIVDSYNVSLNIYGNVSASFINYQSPKVNIGGYRTEINTIYADVDIVINPVRFGAGLKIKNVEALAHGKPLITTRHSARGLERGIGRAFLAADSDLEFLNDLKSIIEDDNLRITLGFKAHQFISDEFSAEKCFQPLMNIIDNS